MEILFELLFGLFGFIFEIAGELILQLVLQALVELGVHAVRQVKADAAKDGSVAKVRAKKPLHPLAASALYLLGGAAIGVVSVFVVPRPMIDDFFLRVANLLLTPFFSGCLMSLMGAWRRRRGEELVRLDKFAYGFLFAFGMALVRFLAAQGVILT